MTEKTEAEDLAKALGRGYELLGWVLLGPIVFIPVGIWTGDWRYLLTNIAILFMGGLILGLAGSKPKAN